MCIHIYVQLWVSKCMRRTKTSNIFFECFKLKKRTNNNNNKKTTMHTECTFLLWGLLWLAWMTSFHQVWLWHTPRTWCSLSWFCFLLASPTSSAEAWCKTFSWGFLSLPTAGSAWELALSQTHYGVSQMKISPYVDIHPIFLSLSLLYEFLTLSTGGTGPPFRQHDRSEWTKNGCCILPGSVSPGSDAVSAGKWTKRYNWPAS